MSTASCPVPFVCQYPVLCLMVLLSILYLLWYSVMVVSKPVLYGGKDGLKDYLVKHCPLLTQPYRPTIWAWHYHGTTILRPLLQRLLPISFKRQLVQLPDGGQVGLDWAGNDTDISRPILLIIPGLSGDSSINYVQHFVRDGLECGYRCVVFNQRGMGNVLITSPRLVAGSNVHDLEVVLSVIQSHYPLAPVVSLGVSLGGIILTNYLHSAGDDSKISACINFSTPWSSEKTRPELEGKWLNKLLYVGFLLSRLRPVVRKNAKMLRENPLIDVKRALQVSTLTEFDEALTAPSYGFESSDQYYDQCRIYDKLNRIRVPFLCVMSMDDPFAPLDSIPISEFESNPNTLLVLTRHGGHFGFLEGLFPRGRSWMNRLVHQFLNANHNLQQRC